jgi:hypothetical protein
MLSVYFDLVSVAMIFAIGMMGDDDDDNTVVEGL